MRPSLMNDPASGDGGSLSNYRQLYWTLKPLFFEVPTGEPSAGFVGRQWLYREISEHLTSDLPTNRGVIVAGNPAFGRGGGNGNGELATRLLPADVDSMYGHSQLSLGLQHQAKFHASQQQVDSMRVLASQIVAYHFCQADNSPTCLVPEFVHSVAAQLSQAPQLTPYYELVNSDTELQNLLSLPGCVSDPSAAFVTGILEPLANLRRLGKLGGGIAQTCLVVIDGLCEAEVHRPDHGNTIASFLAKHLAKFPEWLKVVCTVRSALQDLVTRQLPFQRISLDKTDVDERLNKDMTDYILTRVARSPATGTTSRPSRSRWRAVPRRASRSSWCKWRGAASSTSRWSSICWRGVTSS